MREIVTIQAGLCCNQIGSKFWETIGKEHCIDNKGQFYGGSDEFLKRVDVFYYESSTCQYVPRAILVDLDQSSLGSITEGPMGKLFCPDNVVGGSASAGNNWAKGHHTDGAALSECIMDTIRMEVCFI